MVLSSKPLVAIKEADLKELIENRVREGKTIEYKRGLPGTSDNQKREFLADASSFANSAGGHIIYGMEEKKGEPTNLCGLGQVNGDEEILRLEGILQTGVDPRMPGISIQPIHFGDSNVAIVIRIPRSWSLPHMITFKRNSKFYSRNSAGKYQLDVGELRSLFLLSETTGDQVRGFRMDRVDAIRQGNLPVELGWPPKTVLHVVPISALGTSAGLDVTSIFSHSKELRPVYSVSCSSHPNFDGFVIYCRYATSSHSFYIQIFRNGAIEAVDSIILSKQYIPSVEFEKELLHWLSQSISFYRNIGVEPPFVVMLTLLGVAGYTIDNEPIPKDSHFRPIDRNDLVIPEAVIDSYDVSAAEVMKPIFDAVWNAAGYFRCMNYDESGKRLEK